MKCSTYCRCCPCLLGPAQVDENMAERTKGRGHGETMLGCSVCSIFYIYETCAIHCYAQVRQRLPACVQLLQKQISRRGDTSGDWAKGWKYQGDPKEGC